MASNGGATAVSEFEALRPHLLAVAYRLTGSFADAEDAVQDSWLRWNGLAPAERAGITRKAYGGAYVVMDSKSVGSDLTFAWPSAELAVMGPQGAVEILYRRELQNAADPVAARTQLVDDYTERFANPYVAAERGIVDDVIDPADTRRKVIAGFDMLRSKREELPKRKHGNVPL